uniref:Uncharacterized protein n=1 Tax=Caenorhabditis japonica TaxID=281687 RepID=A0A8R1ELX0_CAEJA
MVDLHRSRPAPYFVQPPRDSLPKNDKHVTIKRHVDSIYIAWYTRGNHMTAGKPSGPPRDQTTKRATGYGSVTILIF